jgi:hypothetical protein
MALALSEEQRLIVGDVARWYERQGLPGLLGVSLGFLENHGFDPWNTTGDNGKSGGIFQVYTPAHPPHPITHWLGRSGTVRAMELMRTRWLGAYHKVPVLFGPDPAVFLLWWWKPAQGGSHPLTLAECRVAVERAREALALVGGEKPMGIQKPAIVWEPAHSDNYAVGRGGVLFEGLCLHITDGGKPGGWFAMSLAQRRAAFAAQGRDPNLAGVGATHFSVSREDEPAAQHVSLLHSPYAQGLIQGRGWQTPLIAENPGISPNSFLVSYEHAARRGEKFTPVQWRRSVALGAWAWVTEIEPHAHRTGATLSRKHVLQHSDVDSMSRAMCAGLTEAEMERYIADLAAEVARIKGGVVPPAPPVPEPKPPVKDYRALALAEIEGMIAAAMDDKLRAEVRILTGHEKLAKL